MNMNLFYEKTYDYLVQKAKNNNVNEEKLQEYFTPETGSGEIFQNRPEKTLNNLFFRFAFHAQNGGQIRKVIKFPDTNSEEDIKREKLFSDIFCDYNPNQVLDTYKDEEELFDAFIQKLGFERVSKKSKTNNYKKSMPYKYCNSVFSAAAFLHQFDSYNAVINKLKFFGEMAPIYLAYEIFGFGVPLACDFIKELDEDFNDFPKPDTHIIKILFELGFIDKKSGSEAEYQSIKRMKELVEEIKLFDETITAYKLDKIFWLIATEDFYNDGGKKNSGSAKRDAFIKYIKQFM